MSARSQLVAAATRDQVTKVTPGAHEDQPTPITISPPAPAKLLRNMF